MASKDVGFSSSVVFTAIEGNQVRFGGTFAREQRTAAVAFGAQFGLEFFGLGGNATISIQATPIRRDVQATPQLAAPPLRPQPLYGRLVARPAPTARTTIARVNTDPLDPYSPFDPLPPVFVPL